MLHYVQHDKSIGDYAQVPNDTNAYLPNAQSKNFGMA